MKKATKHGRVLEFGDRTARGAASPNVKTVFAALPTPNEIRMINQKNNRVNNAFNQQANFKLRCALCKIQASTVASYTSGYVAQWAAAAKIANLLQF